MAIQILMPALSPTMEEGTLAKWLVKEGDTITSGDMLAEIETDKATMELEAVDEGIMGKILVPEGTENVAINTLIAVILEEGDEAGDIVAAVEGDDPETGAHRNLDGIEGDDRIVDRPFQGLDALAAVARRGVNHDHGEFIAADARRHVDGADAFTEQARHMAQHFVSSLMAQGVVDRLEIIEVDEGQNAGAFQAHGDGKGMAELFVETAAVDQPGQFVPIGQGLEHGDTLALGGQLLLGLGGDDQRLFEQAAQAGAVGAGSRIASRHQAVGDDPDIVHQVDVFQG